MFTANFKWHVIIGDQKNDFSSEFKLELVSTYHLKFCCENVMDVYIALFFFFFNLH